MFIDRSASIVEIRKAYRKIAFETHPDINQNDDAQEKFTSLNEAYCVLKNFNSKVKYDKMYDVYILKLAPKNNERFEARSNSRRNSVARRSKKGQARANTNSKMSEKKFNRKTKNSSFWDGFFSILELLTIFG